MGSNSSTHVAPVQLGDALREHRLARRMTQRHLAMRLGVTQQTIARWEKGWQPRSDMVQAILAELGMPMESATGLADVISMPGRDAPTAHPSTDDTEMSEMKIAFIRGCVQIVSRGDRLPDDLMRAIARQVDVLG